VTRRQAVVTASLLLACQNIVLFWPHYVHDAGFPFDFSLSYFAVARFWITGLQHGSLPQWVAQQAMGYPLFMNLQSGLFYPPFWLIVLIGQVYTLHTAVVVQCLHVLAGASACGGW